MYARYALLMILVFPVAARSQSAPDWGAELTVIETCGPYEQPTESRNALDRLAKRFGGSSFDDELVSRLLACVENPKLNPLVRTDCLRLVCEKAPAASHAAILETIGQLIERIGDPTTRGTHEFAGASALIGSFVDLGASDLPTAFWISPQRLQTLGIIVRSTQLVVLTRRLAAERIAESGAPLDVR